LEVEWPMDQDTCPRDRTMEPLESAAALTFRRFEADDLDVLESWLEDAGLRPSARVRRDLRIRRLTDDDRIVTRIVDAGGHAVGFFRLDLAPDRSAELTVFVDGSSRRRGVGRSIVEQAVAEARERGLVRMVAAVAIANDPAHSFFSEIGFEQGDTSVPGFVHYERFLHRSDCTRPLEIRP
jgi:GNAT superfamily N-acetyltransferase